MKTNISQISLSAWWGILLMLTFGLIPPLRMIPELFYFRGLVLERCYQSLAEIIPPLGMRLLTTSMGELFVFAVLGAFLGLVLGLLVYGVFSRSKAVTNIAPSILILSVGTGILFFIFELMWLRLAIYHSLRRMISREGLIALALCLAAATSAGYILFWGLKLVFKRLPAKIILGIGVSALLAVYLNLFSSPVTAASLAEPVSNQPIKQVILLGGDAANWDVALPMINEGKLPNLEKFMKKGTWGDLRTTLPWKSPILWASIGTGKREGKHGIHDFVERNKEDNTVVPMSISSRKVKTIWDIVSERGLRVNVVNWYGAWPAEPLNGTMVSNRILVRGIADRVYPANRTEEIDKLIEEKEAAGISRNEKMVAEIGLNLLQKDNPDVHVLYLREIDHMQHFYWKYHAARRVPWLAKLFYGEIEESEIAEKGHKIEEAYIELDRVLGELLNLAGPETLLMLVSDHGGGIKSQNRLYYDLNPLLEQWGQLKYVSSDRKKIDWTHTQIFDGTKSLWGGVRELFVSQRPEGPYGSGLSREEQRKMLDDLVDKLKNLKTQEGEYVVKDAWVQESKEESLRAMVRVNMRLSENDSIKTDRLSLQVSKIVWRTDLTGNHRMHGLLVMAGPGVKAGYQIKAASLLDITPTLLYLLNLPVADDMDGRVLLDAINSNVRDKQAVQRIPTYETGNRHKKTAAKKSAADEQLLEQLQSLGYIQ